MKAGPAIAIVLAAAAVWYFSGLGITAATTQYVISGFNINSPTDWIITITVQNVSNTTVNLNSLAGTLTLNGTSMGSLSEFQGTIPIPGNSSTNVNVHFTPSLFGALSTIVNTVNNGTASSYTVAVQGQANVNGLVVPFSDSETFSV